MPFDRSRYPSNWRDISLRIRARDAWCCKWCAIPNHTYYYRDAGSCVVLAAGNREEAEMEAPMGVRIRRVVLTVAHHPDPDPMNCSDENLQSLCQACHLRLDSAEHMQHAAQTRRRRKVAAGQTELVF